MQQGFNPVFIPLDGPEARPLAWNRAHTDRLESLYYYILVYLRAATILKLPPVIG